VLLLQNFLRNILLFQVILLRIPREFQPPLGLEKDSPEEEGFQVSEIGLIMEKDSEMETHLMDSILRGMEMDFGETIREMETHLMDSILPEMETHLVDSILLETETTFGGTILTMMVGLDLSLGLGVMDSVETMDLTGWGGPSLQVSGRRLRAMRIVDFNPGVD